MHPVTSSSGQVETTTLWTAIQVWLTTFKCGQLLSSVDNYFQVGTTTFKRGQLLFGCRTMEDEEQTRQMYTLQDVRQRLIPKFRVQGFVYKCKINLREHNQSYAGMQRILHRVIQGKSCIVFLLLFKDFLLHGIPEGTSISFYLHL